MALFENYEGRMPQLQPVLDKYGFKSFEDVKAFTNGKGVDAYSIVESTQPICFENVKWAYELGAAIAMKEGATKAADAAKWIGVGLQAFCIPGSVADQRQVGIGHGNLGDRSEREQGPYETAPRYPERSRQGRRYDHQPYQRFHLCADQV